jgi:hypothetical protein
MGHLNIFISALLAFNAGKADLDPHDSSLNSLIFSPSSPPTAPAPSPLPLFDAAAAFGWSRQLSRRIKSPARIQAH